MPNPRLKNFLKFKQNPDFFQFKELEDMRRENETFKISMAQQLQHEATRVLGELMASFSNKLDELVMQKTTEILNNAPLEKYLSPRDVNEMIQIVSERIPKPKDGNTPTAEMLTSLIMPLIPPPPTINENILIEKILSKIKLPDSVTRAEVAAFVEHEIETALQNHKTLSEEDVLRITKKIQTTFDPNASAEDIARALETLKGKKRLDYYALKNLPDLAQREGKRTLHRGGQGLAVFAYDLTSLTDGTTKIFTIPSNTRIIAVLGTDFPVVLRPTTDFTGTGTTTLTLTSAVPAPTTGATLIVLYAA